MSFLRRRLERKGCINGMHSISAEEKELWDDYYSIVDAATHCRKHFNFNFSLNQETTINEKYLIGFVAYAFLLIDNFLRYTTYNRIFFLILFI